MNKRTALIVGMVVVAAVLAAISLSREPKNEEVVRFGYLPVVHALPLYLAAEKGYFEEEGIKAEITKFEAPNQIIDALLSDHIDMAMAAATGITAVAEAKKPGSLKIFSVAGGDDTHLADALIVRADDEARSVEDLRGKKVGVLPGIQWRTIARNLFSQHGLDIEKDLTLIELAVPLQAQALASNQVDALLAIEPVLTIAEAEGISRVLLAAPNLTYVANPFYAGVGNVSTSFLNEHPETFAKAMKVLKRATDEVNADPDAARVYLPSYTPLTEELAAKVHLTVYKMYTDMTEADVDAVQKFIDVFVTYGAIEKPIRAQELILR